MNSKDLTEIAALYALDALDAEEKSSVEAHYENQPEFQVEVSEATAVAAMLAYDVPILPMATDLKTRLFERIAVDATPDVAAVSKEDRETIALRKQVETATWQVYEPAPGVQFSTVRADSDTRHLECFVRSFGQIKFPAHRHAGNEEILVLEGDLVIGDQHYVPGDRIYSQPGTVHQPETINGCVLFLRTSLDDEILSSLS